MERKIKQYELKQHGKKYILTSQIFEDKLRFACVEYSIDKNIIYIGEFTVLDFIQLNTIIFSSLTEITKAQELFDMLIRNQRVSIELKDNYLNLNIIIKRENQPNEKLTIKLNLFNQEESKINIKTTTETKINQNGLIKEKNILNENLLSYPITNDKVSEQNIPKTYKNLFLQEKEDTNPLINPEYEEQKDKNHSSNINDNYKEQLILSPKLNKELNINNQNQSIETQININNDNIMQEYIQNSLNNKITQEKLNIPMSPQNINTHYEEQNTNSPTFNYQESQKKILSPDVKETAHTDNFIQQFLQSSENISPQKQSITNIISSEQQHSQQGQDNINSIVQYNQYNNINQDLKGKQITNIDNSNETYNNLQINNLITKNESTPIQYIEQPEVKNQINTHFSFQDQYIPQTDEITNNLKSLDNYIQQSNSNIISQNQYIQSIQQPTTNISSSTSNTQTQYIQIPTSNITIQKQYIVQNQPMEGQTINYNMNENQVKKTKRIKNEKIVLSLLPQPQESKIEETNYENSAQIYSSIKEPEIQIPQIIYKDNPELENLRNENSRLLEEVNSLKKQIKIYINENKTLKINKTVKTEVPTNDFQEIELLNKEVEKLRMELSTYQEYKIQKEEEINILNMKIKNLLIRLKELETRNENLRAYIEKLSNMKSESGNQCEALTIQDTRLEIIRGDIIENANELELLTRRICQNKFKKITMNLLYKAIIDSDKAEVFHRKCDSAEGTLVLVRSANGKRFGGFTSCSWEGNSIQKKDENAFIFSLDKMKIYNVIKGEEAIGCFPNFGPVFLGCQIRIYDEFFKNGGSTYEKGLNYETKDDFELTGGLKTFSVNDIEVYSVELIN